jgi:hypothetical protein
MHSQDAVEIMGIQWDSTSAIHRLQESLWVREREVLYSILKDFAVFMKLVRLIKMCLNETYSKVRIGKHLSESFPLQNSLKQWDALSPLLFNSALDYAIRKGQEN